MRLSRRSWTAKLLGVGFGPRFISSLAIMEAAFKAARRNCLKSSGLVGMQIVSRKRNIQPFGDPPGYSFWLLSRSGNLPLLQNWLVRRW